MAMTDLFFLLVFLPFTVGLYWAAHRSVTWQNRILLAASFFFYSHFGWNYALVLAACILITWTGGLLWEKTGSRCAAGIMLAVNIGLLLVFKYTDLILADLNLQTIELILPIGLSFYVFQSSTYLLELIMGRGSVEHDLVDYALFVSFFPTIVSGPIQRSSEMLSSIRKKKSLSYEQVLSCFMIYLWGAFLKMVIADRLALLTSPVFAGYRTFSGSTVAMACIFYSFQIYADFWGYSCMATSAAGLFGYELKENFHQPYLALTIADFWRRWHISLTSWLRDYLYIPLGGNRCGKARQCLNILIVFTVSGLWHGAANHYIVWGLLHAFYQIIGLLSRKTRERLTAGLPIAISHLLQRVVVFGLVTVAWIFFRADSVSAGLGMIRQLAVPGALAIEAAGMNVIEWRLSWIGLAVLAVVSGLRERGHHADFLTGQNRMIRWCCLLFLIYSILIFGIYGPDYSAASFIYEGF